MAQAAKPKSVQKSTKKPDARTSPSAKSTILYRRMIKKVDGQYEDFDSGYAGTNPRDVKGKIANTGSIIVSRLIRFKLLNPLSRARTEAELDALQSPVTAAAVLEAEKEEDTGKGKKSHWDYAYTHAGFECYVLK